MKAPGKSVLVVEDDADIRESILGVLVGEGYEANACSNGLEALERLRTGPGADVILLDLMMPVMDGWQFRVEQRRDPRLAGIPVVVISADTTAKAVAIDADAYLRKPVGYGALVASIERTLLEAERRRLQATLVETERLASLGTLAAGVAHEINNPLAYVMANLEYVARSSDGGATPPLEPPRIREVLAEAIEGCERIRTIVRDLQLFSREGEDDEVDVRRVLDSSANIVMHEIRARATLTRDYAEVPSIRASASRLGQVFLNLVHNAAQAVREGEPSRNEIRLVVRANERDILVDVRDTGEGIPPEIRSRIFEPFFTTKPIGVGTGLGLSISHRIVTAMGGALSVESEPGVGTVFHLRLPLTEATRRDALSRPVRTRGRRARLLVIDDEVMIGAMLERVLGDEHEVHVMTDPGAALARLGRGERFDLILCDMMMPGLTGIDVHAAVALLSPEQAQRMIFLTGGSSTPRAREFLARPGTVVVDKPFATEELLRRIDATLAAFDVGS